MNIHHKTEPFVIEHMREDGYFTGYASVFGVVDSHNEQVAKGAFLRSLSEWRYAGRSPAMLWMHDPTQPIGVWLMLQEDSRGLLVEGRLALGTQKGREAHELLKMGALTGLSIGYRVVASQIDAQRKVRILTDVDLFEISVVTFPANESARVRDVKSPLTAMTNDDVRAVVARLKKTARTLKTSSRRKA
jgi:uncharacterized protein